MQRRLVELGLRPGPARRGLRPGDGARRAGVPGRGRHRGRRRRRAARRARRCATPSRRRTRGRGVAGRRALAEARRWLGTHEDPPGLEPHPVRRLVRARRRALVQHLRQLLLRRRRRHHDRGGLPRRGLLRGAAARTCRRPRRGCARPGMWLGRVPPRPATSRSTTGTAARPTTSASSSASPAAALRGDRGQHRASANDANGGEVMRRRRTLADVDGFGRVAA